MTALTTRERARLRKQNQRQRARERARLAAQEQARREEAMAEALAPAVMRNPVLLPDGRMLIGQRVHIRNGRVVRGPDLLSGVGGAANSPSFTAAHKSAARKLQLDWQDVGTGVGVSATDWLRTGGGGTGMPAGHDILLVQMKARGRLEGAISYIGAFAPAVVRILLDGIPIYVFASEVGKSLPDAIAWLALGLDRLVAFYNPPVEARSCSIQAIGPARSAYEMEVV